MGKTHRKTNPAGLIPANKSYSQGDFQDTMEEVFECIKNDEIDEAREFLDLVPVAFHKRVEYLYARAVLSYTNGDFLEALDDLELAIRREPDYIPAHAVLVSLYDDMDLTRLAWLAAERLIRLAPPEAIKGDDIREAIIEPAKEEWEDVAQELQISNKGMREAAFHYEQGLISLDRGKYLEAGREFETASRSAPAWIVPRNNRALALFYQGRVKDALRELEVVLKQDPQELFALSSVIEFYTLVGDRQKAEPYLERLRPLLASASLEDIDLFKILQGLAVYEADQDIWEIAERLDRRAAKDQAESRLYILGVAAARTGHLVEALRFLRLSSRNDTPIAEQADSLISEIKKAQKGKIPIDSPSLRSSPYLNHQQIWPYPIAEKLYNQITPSGKPERTHSILKAYLERYPYVFGAMRLILWHTEDEASRDLAIESIGTFDSPQAYDELRRFVSSAVGTDHQRMLAVRTLSDARLLKEGEELRFWLTDRNEWTQIRSYISQVGPVEPSPCNPKAMDLVEKSRRAQEGASAGQVPPVAVEYLEKAIQIDPQCAIAFHNLGTLYLRLKEEEKGEALIRRSIEVDPDYLFGYTTLAFLELQRNHVEASEDYLQKVFTASAIDPVVFERALSCRIQLDVIKKDSQSAEQALQMLKAFNSEYPDLENMETSVYLIKGFPGWEERWLRDVHRHRRRQLNSPIDPQAGLKDTLDRVSREALGATLRAWRLSSSGRKADVIARLVEVMTSSDELSECIEEALDDEERSALVWLLEEGGVRPWAEFTARFEDDFDESPYWQWHDPETVPGVLRMFGFMTVGTLDGREVAFIPNDLRPLLQGILNKS